MVYSENFNKTCENKIYVENTQKKKKEVKILENIRNNRRIFHLACWKHYSRPLKNPKFKAVFFIYLFIQKITDVGFVLQCKFLHLPQKNLTKIVAYTAHRSVCLII